MANVPTGFEFREYPNSPERDTAREFYELVLDLSWLAEGPKKDNFLAKLKEARDAAMEIASEMVRS